MTVQGIERHEPKKPLENVACFGVALGALVVAALVLQWLMSMIP
jgi:hypothetical protein